MTKSIGFRCGAIVSRRATPSLQHKLRTQWRGCFEEAATSSNIWKRKKIDEEEEETTNDGIPTTFREYLQYCKGVGAVDVPELIQKEGIPDKVTNVILALEDTGTIQYLDDRSWYFMILSKWLPAMKKHQFHVFDDAARREIWSDMMHTLNNIKDRWGPLTTAALLHSASSLGFEKETQQLYEEAHSKQYLTRYIFPSLIYSKGRARELTDANEVYKYLEQKGVRAEDYRAIVYANSRVGCWREAQYYFDLFKKSCPNEPPSRQDHKLMVTLLSAYARGRNYKGAMKLLEEITTKYRPSNIVYSAAINAHCDGSIRGFNSARMLFLRAYDVTQISSANAWMKVMIKLYESISVTDGSNSDEIEKRLLLLKDTAHTPFRRLATRKRQQLMKRFWGLYDICKQYTNQFKPDAITYFHALQFAKACHDPERAQDVLRDAAEAGVKHTKLYNLAIGAYAKCMDVRGTYDLFKELRNEKLVPDISTYTALMSCLEPGSGAKNAAAILDSLAKSGLDPTGPLFAAAVRTYAGEDSTEKLVGLCRMMLNTSFESADGSGFVLDNAQVLRNLEIPFSNKNIGNRIKTEYPDLSERFFELAALPYLSLRAPRPCALTPDDVRFGFTVPAGKSIWVLTDEWMLPLGDKLGEYIQDAVTAKDRIIVPYYCIVRLGSILRREQSNLQLKEAAAAVLYTLQGLFEQSAEAHAKGEPVVVDTVYFTEQIESRGVHDLLLGRLKVPEEYEKKLASAEGPVYDMELRVHHPIADLPTLKYLSRKSVAIALMLKTFQISSRSTVYFCARDPEHLQIAKDAGLDTFSVEDALGPDWLKTRKEEEELLMLSWKGDVHEVNQIEENIIPALTSTVYNDNEFSRLEEQERIQLEIKTRKERIQQRRAELAAAEASNTKQVEYKSEIPLMQWSTWGHMEGGRKSWRGWSGNEVSRRPLRVEQTENETSEVITSSSVSKSSETILTEETAPMPKSYESAAQERHESEDESKSSAEEEILQKSETSIESEPVADTEQQPSDSRVAVQLEETGEVPMPKSYEAGEPKAKEETTSETAPMPEAYEPSTKESEPAESEPQAPESESKESEASEEAPKKGKWRGFGRKEATSVEETGEVPKSSKTDEPVAEPQDKDETTSETAPMPEAYEPSTKESEPAESEPQAPESESKEPEASEEAPKKGKWRGFGRKEPTSVEETEEVPKSSKTDEPVAEPQDKDETISETAPMPEAYEPSTKESELAESEPQAPESESKEPEASEEAPKKGKWRGFGRKEATSVEETEEVPKSSKTDEPVAEPQDKDETASEEETAAAMPKTYEPSKDSESADSETQAPESESKEPEVSEEAPKKGKWRGFARKETTSVEETEEVPVPKSYEAAEPTSESEVKQSEDAKVSEETPEKRKWRGFAKKDETISEEEAAPMPKAYESSTKQSKPAESEPHASESKEPEASEEAPKKGKWVGFARKETTSVEETEVPMPKAYEEAEGTSEPQAPESDENEVPKKKKLKGFTSKTTSPEEEDVSTEAKSNITTEVSTESEVQPLPKKGKQRSAKKSNPEDKETEEKVADESSVEPIAVTEKKEKKAKGKSKKKKSGETGSS